MVFARLGIDAYREELAKAPSDDYDDGEEARKLADTPRLTGWDEWDEVELQETSGPTLKVKR